MELYLLRHATAVDAGAPSAPDDRSRYLSDEGVAETKAAAKGIRRIQSSFEAILTSPYPRARQTAEIVAKALKSPPPVENLALLAPGADLKAVFEELRRRGLAGAVMLVGHNPDFEQMTSDAVTHRGAARLQVKKGGLAIIDFIGGPRPGGGTLRALFTCKHLRRIGE